MSIIIILVRLSSLAVSVRVRSMSMAKQGLESCIFPPYETIGNNKLKILGSLAGVGV